MICNNMTGYYIIFIVGNPGNGKKLEVIRDRGKFEVFGRFRLVERIRDYELSSGLLSSLFHSRVGAVYSGRNALEEYSRITRDQSNILFLCEPLSTGITSRKHSSSQESAEQFKAAIDPLVQPPRLPLILIRTTSSLIITDTDTIETWLWFAEKDKKVSHHNQCSTNIQS